MALYIITCCETTESLTAAQES